MFAHTIVDAPKNGAISRAAAISAPSVEEPTTKTSSSSGGRARVSGAAGCGGGGDSWRVATGRVWRGGLPTAPASSVRAHGHRRPRRRSTARTSGTRSPSSGGGSREPPVLIERAEGCTLYDTDGQRLPRRRVLAVVQRPRAPPPGDRRSGPRAARPRRALDDARALAPAAPRCSPSAWSRSRRPASSASSTPTTGRRPPRSRVKMAYQYWQHRGEPARTGFVCLRDAYHGDTLGSVSVGGIELFHSLFRPLLFDAWHAEPGDLEHMRALLEAHGDAGRGGGHGAARPGRGGDARAPGGLPARRARAVRRVRRAADLRRGGDRLRAHRARCSRSSRRASRRT